MRPSFNYETSILGSNSRYRGLQDPREKAIESYEAPASLCMTGSPGAVPAEAEPPYLRQYHNSTPDHSQIAMPLPESQFDLALVVYSRFLLVSLDMRRI